MLGTWDGKGSVDRIAYNRIEANATGIDVQPNSPAIFDAGSVGNCLTGNGTGLAHDGTGALLFEQNWWGAAGGPSGVGPGAGDSIAVTGTGSVDFTPWDAEGCPAPEPDALGGALAAVASLAWLRARRRDARRAGS